MTHRTLVTWLVIISSIVSFSVTLAASSGKTIPFDEVNQRLETVLQELFGGTIEATSKSLMRVRVPISQLEAMADQVNGGDLNKYGGMVLSESHDEQAGDPQAGNSCIGS